MMKMHFACACGRIHQFFWCSAMPAPLCACGRLLENPQPIDQVKIRRPKVVRFNIREKYKGPDLRMVEE